MQQYRSVLRPVPYFEPPARCGEGRGECTCVAHQAQGEPTRARADTSQPSEKRMPSSVSAATTAPDPVGDRRGAPFSTSGRAPSASRDAGKQRVLPGDMAAMPERRAPETAGRPRMLSVPEAGTSKNSSAPACTVLDPASDSDRGARGRTDQGGGGANTTVVCGGKGLRGGVARHRAPEGIRRALRAGHSARRGVSSGSGQDPDVFAHTVLRIVLEVLDRRRPVTQLTAFAAPHVLAALRTLVTGDHAPGRSLGPAVLSRVRVITVDERTAEVCASYQRGPRHFALAARIARTRKTGWQLTALRVR